jgi:hypothetical protein
MLCNEMQIFCCCKSMNHCLSKTGETLMRASHRWGLIMVLLPCRNPLATPACLSSFHASLGKPWGFQWHPVKCHHALLTARHMV